MSQLALTRPLFRFKRKEKEKEKQYSKLKEKKRKEILNNDLAVLPSHDKRSRLLSSYSGLPISTE